MTEKDVLFFPLPPKKKKKCQIAGEDPLIQPDHLTRNLKAAGNKDEKGQGKKGLKSVTFPELWVHDWKMGEVHVSAPKVF